MEEKGAPLRAPAPHISLGRLRAQGGKPRGLVDSGESEEADGSIRLRGGVGAGWELRRLDPRA